jgi:hypothetical protein
MVQEFLFCFTNHFRNPILGQFICGFHNIIFLLLIHRRIAFGRTIVAQHSAPSGSRPTITSHEFYRQTIDRLLIPIDVSVISTRIFGTRYYLEREYVFQADNLYETNVVLQTSNIYPLPSATVGAPLGHLEPHLATTRCRNSVFQAT